MPKVAPSTQTALLVPVPEAEPVVGEWRLRYDPSAAQGVPAHVTVLFPFLPPHQVDRGVLSALEALFGVMTAFEFVLARVGRWPGVVYLDPEPQEPFRALTEAVFATFPQAPPYGGAFAEVIPHVTAADLSTRPDPAILDEVERAIVGAVPLEARATEVWLMEGDGIWRLRARYALAGDD